MKLHLPIALLAAVISAQFVSAGVTYTYNGAGDPVSSDFGSGIYNGHIETVYQGNYSGLAASDGHAAGNISAIPRKLTDLNGNEVNAATSAHVILTGEGSKATYVIGGGPRDYFVTGNKTVTVQDKAYAAYIAGGKSFTTDTDGLTIDGYTGYGYSYWQPKNSDATITVNLKDAACVAIIGGNAQPSNGPDYEAAQAVKKLGVEGAREYLLSADSALALDEKVVINVEDGRLGYASYDKAHSKENLYGYAFPVISGAGHPAYSVNNDVAINIKGNSIVNGSIVAGAASNTYNVKGLGEVVASAYVGGSTSVALTDGLVKGNIYGGGDGDAVVKGNTQIVLDGTALVEGDVYGAGRNGDTVDGNTNVVLRGDKVEVKGIISGRGEGGLSTVDGDRVITFDDHGDVNWNQIKDFNVVELTGGTSTTLGEDANHTLSTDFEKVVISGPSTTVTGTIGRPVELHITDDCWVELKGKDGTLTTNAGSVIKDNTTKDIVIHANANFNGTSIENSTIVADGNIGVLDHSTVKDANLVAANGKISVNGGSTIEGGEITVGKQGLSLGASDVKVDMINGVDELLLDTQNDWSLEVNDDLKLAEGSALRGFGLGENIWAYGELKADSVSIESGLKGALYAVNIEAKDGDIVIGGGNDVQVSHLTASDSVVLKDGVSLTHGSTATALTGDVWLNGGVKVENSDLIAENGIVKFNQSTMNGGKIVAGEALQMDNASVVVADSINNGKAVKLDVNSGAHLNLSEEPTAASLTVNSDLVLADGSKFEGQKKVPYVTSDNNKDVEGLLAAHSIKSEGAVTFDLATVKATAGNIELIAGSEVTNTNLVATDSVQLTGTTMEGGSIAAGNKVVLDKSVVSVNSIGTIGTDGTSVTDGAVVKSTNSQLEVTQGALVLNDGSEVTNSSLVAKNGDVVLAGTTMTGTTVETSGMFSVTAGSKVTMGNLEGLNNIHISDSSLSTEKLVVNKGETFNVTGEDRVGDNLVLTGTGKSNDEALVVDGTMNVTDATLTIKGTNSQLGIGYGADGGVLNVTNSKVDVSEGTTLHIGYNKDMGKSELNIKNSEFIGGSNNAWLGGGTINVTENSTMSVCSTKDDHYNYRVLMGLSGNTVNLNVNSDSHFESNASQFVTNFNSDTNVIITVGKGSTFTQNAKINSSAPYGVTETITYLLDSGTDANGNKYAPVNNVYTTITAVDGGSVAFNSGVTYVGSALDQAENCTTKGLKLNVGKGSSMSFNDMEVYATTNVKNDGAFKAADINVHGGATFTYVGGGKMTASSLGVDKDGVMNLGSSDARGNVVLNAAGSGQTGIISGALNVTNTDLVVTGSSSSQFWIDGGTMTVDKGSKVDLSVGTTLRVGNENAGKLNVLGGSTLTGGANNLWVYDNSTINVSGKDSVMGVCNDTDHYNYRVLMGITNHNGAQGSATQTINVTEGGKFTSSATQFVTNFHSNTTTNIEVSGENSLFHQTGKTVNKNHYVVGTTGEWVEVNGKWLDKGSTGDGKYVAGQGDTITYLLSNGTDKDGVLGYPVENAKVNISAKDGGTVKFDSALTYVGNVGVSDAYIKANEKNLATFTVGDKASMSFKQMELYANTVIIFEKPVSGGSTSGSIGDIINGSNADKYTTGGSFSADKITVHAGTQLDVKGNGTDSGSQLILNGTGKSNDEALVVDGHMVVKNANLVMKGSSSQLGIGYNGNGTMEVINSKIDISEGSTLHMGYNAEYTGKLVLDNSQFVGGYNNAWLGGGVLELKNGSTMDVCNVAPKGTEYNYRTILGWDGHDMKVDISGGSTMTSAATQFITNYNSNTNVEIAVDGVGSKLTHEGKTETSKSSYALGYSGEWVEKEVITGYKDGVAQTKVALADKDTVGRVNSGEGTIETVAYLLDSGTDEFGAKKAAVNNVKTTIKATNGGAVEFGSNKTYIGSVQDKALGYTNKHAYLSVDSKSSMSFGDMEIYADTTIDNQGTFEAGAVTVYDGATLENLGSLSLSEVALAGGELFNAGTLELDSLVLEHASLLFAVSDWENATSTIDYKGAELTNFRNLTVSINDMVDSYGIDLTGTAASDLIAAGDEGFEFSFTLAKGSDLFEEQLAYVLNAEENLADFSITVGDAVLRLADGELKDLKVTDTDAGVVISGTAIIPEPTTATLSLLALAALAARRRRK